MRTKIKKGHQKCANQNGNVNNEVDFFNPILLRFSSAKAKNIFLGKFCKQRIIYTDEIGFPRKMIEAKNRIYAFERLPSNIRNVYLKAKHFKKANDYKYLWTKDGNIFLRKVDNSKIITVFSYTDFYNI